MQTVQTIEALEALYGAANPASLAKVESEITPLYKKWIEASRFLILSTVGPEGTDASPRGDDGPVVKIADPKTIFLPDWQGNNRMDSLRNIVRDGRASLMFMVPGAKNVVRVNGKAVLSADENLTGTFEQKGKHPRTVIVLTLEEIYFQCAKALMRSRLWEAGDESGLVPSAGDFIHKKHPEVDAKTYDANYPTHAKDRMW